MTAISRSLPPFVEGHVYGHLTVTVDEILWSNKHSQEVEVLLQWWGDDSSITLRPADISNYPESAQGINRVTFSIKTNFSLFKSYLNQFKKLKLLIVEEHSKEILGHVEISGLVELVTGFHIQNYFPITLPSGARIGDLKVNFDLTMNSTAIVEETTLKRNKKQSRKQTKSIQIGNEEQHFKNIKKMSANIPNPTGNSVSLSLQKQIENDFGKQDISGTEFSSLSEADLLEVFDKGKKLRDAMVLSVLEDIDKIDEDMLNVDDSGKLCIDSVDCLTDRSTKVLKTEDGRMQTTYKGKLISDYLEGKTMKEEDEVLVLNTLYPNQGEFSETKANIQSQNQEICLTSKSSCPYTDTNDRSRLVTDKISGLAASSLLHCYSENDVNIFKEINCFRLTVDSLNLTSSGWKKINQSINSKNNTVGDLVPPPGATYFIECNFVVESPRNETQQWKMVPLRFCSRRQIDHVIYFGQSSGHSLRPPHSLAHTQIQLAAMSCLVCWRHLNQRVPALLGQFSLANSLIQPRLENTLTLPVTSGSDIVAYVRLTLQLGKDKLYFGNTLFEDGGYALLQNKSSNITDDKIERHFEVTDSVINKPCLALNNKKTIDNDINLQMQKNEKLKNSILTQIEIPVCSNCKQNMLKYNTDPCPSLCKGCENLFGNQQNLSFNSNFKVNIPDELVKREKRHHEFMFEIDSVTGFPLLATFDDELSCYIDYKFPEITSNTKVEISSSESTSKVVNCGPQLSFSCVHRHVLTLPVVLPLSPLLASTSPGITLRLWLRYYKPTPRDHMVAMALLPIQELCAMELEFDRSKQRSPIIKVLELPLALVPSSVTTPYLHYRTLGVIHVTVSYSNYILTSNNALCQDKQKPEFKIEHHEGKLGKKADVEFEAPNDHKNMLNEVLSADDENTSYTCTIRPITSLLDQIPISKAQVFENDFGTSKQLFWTGPFGKVALENSLSVNLRNESNSPFYSPSKPKFTTSCNITKNSFQECTAPFMKGFDNLAENIEERFKKLQSDMLKQKICNNWQDSRNHNNSMCTDNDDVFILQSLSSNSSMERLLFRLGPPADSKDSKNTVRFSENKSAFSGPGSDKSESDTISGFLKEEKEVYNLGSNESFEREKLEPLNPKTFKAKVKVDRAVNLKAVKLQSSGKKSKVPPSTWVSFGTGDCCEQNCGTRGLVCSGQRFTTHVIRRNYNPIWNLSWDIDLPITYLQQVNKRLVFRVFEENLDVSFGFASANLSILTSGLPCLSSWLNINDLTGACKGQVKVVVTPLEDLSQYQEISVFDVEEEDFEEQRCKESELTAQNGNLEFTSFAQSQAVDLWNDEGSSKHVDKSQYDKDTEIFVTDDGFSADDVISDYKNTLENNFRNEMAGLENLIKFLRVGSISNEISFIGATENKENSNPTFSQQQLSPKPVLTFENSEAQHSCKYPHCDPNLKIDRGACNNEKMFVDASTETMNKDSILSDSNKSSKNSEEILSKLLQQISMFQLPTVKITDNTCQTVSPQTKEICTDTETHEISFDKTSTDKTVHMKDVFTETDDISNGRNLQADNGSEPRASLVCNELASVLLQHFLMCKPMEVKVTDKACQTVNAEMGSTTNSSRMFTRTQPSGMSSQILNDDFSSVGQISQPAVFDSISSEANQTNCERHIAIDNNIKDLEEFLKENFVLGDKDKNVLPEDTETSLYGSLKGMLDSDHDSNTENNQASSDIETLSSSSQVLINSKETLEVENKIIDTQNCDSNDTVTEGADLTRQG